MSLLACVLLSVVARIDAGSLQATGVHWNAGVSNRLPVRVAHRASALLAEYRVRHSACRIVVVVVAAVTSVFSE
jgi:hypothetical protein